jgi:hypothetical protein
MRYFIGFLITIGLIILLIVLLFGGGGSKSKVPTTSKPLADYSSSDAAARLTIDGPVNADTIHKSVQITVDKDEVTFEKFQGYQGHVVGSQHYENNETAYANFLHALAHAGFTRGDTSSALKDERGYCPLGNRYIFEFIQDGKDIERFWATSCGKPKTYLGAPSLTLQLFRAQVPDFAKQVEGSTEALNYAFAQ